MDVAYLYLRTGFLNFLKLSFYNSNFNTSILFLNDDSELHLKIKWKKIMYLRIWPVLQTLWFLPSSLFRTKNKLAWRVRINGSHILCKDVPDAYNPNSLCTSGSLKININAEQRLLHIHKRTRTVLQKIIKKIPGEAQPYCSLILKVLVKNLITPNVAL